MTDPTATAKRIANALKARVRVHSEDPLVIQCDEKGWLIWCIVREHPKHPQQTHSRVDAMYLQDFDRYCFAQEMHPAVAILFTNAVKVQYVQRGFPYSVVKSDDDPDRRWFLLPI